MPWKSATQGRQVVLKQYQLRFHCLIAKPCYFDCPAFTETAFEVPSNLNYWQDEPQGALAAFKDLKNNLRHIVLSPGEWQENVAERLINGAPNLETITLLKSNAAEPNLGVGSYSEKDASRTALRIKEKLLDDWQTALNSAVESGASEELANPSIPEILIEYEY